MKKFPESPFNSRKMAINVKKQNSSRTEWHSRGILIFNQQGPFILRFKRSSSRLNDEKPDEWIKISFKLMWLNVI